MNRLSVPGSARLAAWCTVALVLVGPVSLVMIPEMTTVPGDLAATAALLSDNARLARAGMLGEMGIVAIELVMTVALVALFRDSHRDGALLVGASRLAMAMLQSVTAVAGFAAVAWFSASHADLAGGAALLDLRAAGTYAWQVVFGIHCVALGWVIVRSRLVPRWLGVAMGCAGVAYLAMGGVPLVDPGPHPTLDTVASIVAMFGELPLYVYLLFRRPRAIGSIS